MKRRSFLQLIGLTATAPVLAKLPTTSSNEDKVIELTREKWDKKAEAFAEKKNNR